MLIRIFLLGNAIYGTSYTLSPLFTFEPSHSVPTLPFHRGREDRDILCQVVFHSALLCCLFVCFKLRNCKAL